jgi:phenylacetate-CoA ligase
MQKTTATIENTGLKANYTNNPEYFSVDEMAIYQLQKVKETLNYIGHKSPYYQKLFSTLNIDINSINSWEAFKNLPLTNKDALQLNNDDFLCVSKDEIIDYSSTSGTLGQPVHILLNENDLNRLALNESAGFALAGVTKKDIIQLTTTIDKRFMAGLAYFSGARKTGAGIIRNGSGFPEMQWDTILRFKPTVLIAVPSFVLKLIDFAIDNKIEFQKTSIQKIICIGESIRNSDFSLNNLGQRILSNWDVKLFSTYASTEMQTCFTECEAGNGGHLLPDLIVPEILDENGATCEPGAYGELTITTLGIEGMPLLRYQTGDICRLETSKCSCGRTTPRITPVSGRKKHMLKIKGTTVYPAMIFNVLDGIDAIENYILEATSNDIEGDELKILIGLKAVDAEIGIKIENKLMSALRLKPSISFLPAAIIQKQLFKDGSRKPIRFIDNRK